MWLRDFLSKDLLCCRTIIYGYNSKLSTHKVNTILNYGRGLIEELKKVRNTKKVSATTGGVALEQQYQANELFLLAKEAALVLYRAQLR